MQLQNYSIFPVRAAAILTDAYVAGTILGPIETTGTVVANPSSNNQLVLYVSFTKGSLDSASIKVEFSHNGTTYYQETFSAISAGVSTDSIGVHTISATGNYRLNIPIKDNYIKISAIGTGTATNSSCKVDAVIGTV